MLSLNCSMISFTVCLTWEVLQKVRELPIFLYRWEGRDKLRNFTWKATDYPPDIFCALSWVATPDDIWPIKLLHLPANGNEPIIFLIISTWQLWKSGSVVQRSSLALGHCGLNTMFWTKYNVNQLEEWLNLNSLPPEVSDIMKGESNYTFIKWFVRPWPKKGVSLWVKFKLTALVEKLPNVAWSFIEPLFKNNFLSILLHNALWYRLAF